jgi:hypothetical protein
MLGSSSGCTGDGEVALFDDFLKDTVNLNDTRVSDLETSIEAIKDAVRASDWEPHLNGWMAHGSWAHKTITRLRKSSESGFAIHTGLQPAGSLNHIRPPMGIPRFSLFGKRSRFGDRHVRHPIA